MYRFIFLSPTTWNFIAQMLGFDNMSGCLCMWCLKSPNEWNKHDDEVQPNHAEDWTINKLKAHRLPVAAGKWKTPIEICGVVDFPLWEFIEVIKYTCSMLHREIGSVKHALDVLYDILDNSVEVMSDEEKNILSTAILTDASQEKMEAWKAPSTVDLFIYLKK